ncbi:MAG TPA: ABC transporter permease [Gemmatimonadaceae bacterium]|nr:ABC transporter permease [Gemmatimonadaceae bacterium]
MRTGLDHLRQDVRYALRGLRRSPGFTATVVLTLGLGIGANAAMFGVIDQLMFRPYPRLRHPGDVHRVYLDQTYRGHTGAYSVFPYQRYLDLRNHTTSFSQYAGYAEGTMAVGSGNAARERLVGVVSASFFDFFDGRPALGRYFLASEDSASRGASVAILGYGFWKTQFGGRNVIGDRLAIRNASFTIIGVTPEGFVGVPEHEPPAVFIPILSTWGLYSTGASGPTPFDGRYDWGSTNLIVRRRRGVSVAAASADLTNAWLQSWNAERALDPRVEPATEARPRAIAGALKTAGGPGAGLESKTLLWVTGVAVIVFLIAAANVTNLMLARVLRRRREIAVRLALGTSRGRLMAQFLTESLILALFGCLAGVAIAQWGGAALRLLLVRDGSGLDVVTDWRTLLVASAFALAAGMVTAVFPALLAIRGDLASTLRAGAREGTYQRSRARSALLVLQGALSVILLVGAGLFVRSLNNVRAMRLGYDPAPVLVVNRNLRGLRMTDSQQVSLRRRLLETAQAIPGVERTAWVTSVPFLGFNTKDLYVAGIDSVRRLGQFTYQAATPGFFDVMGTRIIRGRPFTDEDRVSAPRVVVLSDAMGKVLWPGREALGQCIRIGADTAPCTTVIGIAEDAIQTSLTRDDRFRYYLPIDQFGPAAGFAIVLRVRGDPAQRTESVRRALQPVMPGESYVTVFPFRDVVAGQRRSWQIGATMFVAFGLLALLVAAVGLHGVIAYNVAQRTHELGVRIALGAQSRDVVRLVVAQGISFALAGVTIGVTVALLTAGWIQPLLFEQSARDPATYGSVGVLIFLIALLASAVPAVRASRADPNTALRSD